MKMMELKLNNSKVMIVQFRPYTSDPRLHDHGDDYQISIPLIGNSLIEHNHAVVEIDDKHRLVTSPGEEHRHFANEEPGKVLLINLNKKFLENVLEDKLDRSVFSLEFHSLGEGNSDGFKKLTEKVVKQSLYDETEQLEVEQLELELAQLLFSSHSGSHTEQWRKQVTLPYNPLLKRVIDYIESNYAEDLNIDVMAAISGMSKFHFMRLFKENVGDTPSHYVAKVRMTRAKNLLDDSHLDITAIAYEVGFGSLQTFERLFKKYYGISANEYRKQRALK